MAIFRHLFNIFRLVSPEDFRIRQRQIKPVVSVPATKFENQTFRCNQHLSFRPEGASPSLPETTISNIRRLSTRYVYLKAKTLVLEANVSGQKCWRKLYSKKQTNIIMRLSCFYKTGLRQKDLQVLCVMFIRSAGTILSD